MTVHATPPEFPVRFESTRLVRFSDCDPAGMVFYPQYFVMLNALVEDWFTHGLGVNYAQFLGARRLGLPMARLQAEFKAPSRMGEVVNFALALQRLGRRSLELGIQCRGTQGDMRWHATAIIVTTSLDTDGSINIPQDVVEGIHRWQRHQGEN